MSERFKRKPAESAPGFNFTDILTTKKGTRENPEKPIPGWRQEKFDMLVDRMKDEMARHNYDFQKAYRFAFMHGKEWKEGISVIDQGAYGALLQDMYGQKYDPNPANPEQRKAA